MQKICILLAAAFSLAIFGHAQTISTDSSTANGQVAISAGNINSFIIPYSKTTHIVSPEPILYVDISTPEVEGDLPEKNIFRLKPVINNDGKLAQTKDDNFVVTIVTQTFIISYKLSFDRKDTSENILKNTAFILTIDPTKAVQLNNYDKISRSDFDRLSVKAMANKRRNRNIRSYAYGMEFWLNNVYVIGDLILLDLGAKNHTKLQYDLSNVGFKLTDSYRVKASVSQEVEIRPLYSFIDDINTVIERKWRNFYILRKFTFPVQKTLKIDMTEKQISGRPVSLSVSYNQVLRAQTLAD